VLVVPPTPPVLEPALLPPVLRVASTLLAAVSVSGCNTVSLLRRQPGLSALASSSKQSQARRSSHRAALRTGTDMNDILRHDLKVMSAHFK
jgi:hypothetical protein